MSKSRKYRRLLESLYDVSSVYNGFDYWYFKLLNYVLGIYDYEGLPESLPARELECNLILTGHATVFENKEQLVTTITELYGFDEYYRPDRAVYGNALIPLKNLKIGKDCEVIYNNRIRGNILRVQEVDGGLSTFIRRYSRMLADMESSIENYVVNTRRVSYPTARTQQMAAALEDFHLRIAAGEQAVLTDPDYLESFRNVDLAPQRSSDGINDLLIARDKILSTFFREIGVKFVQEQKKAQLTEDEVVADEQMLLINLSDMLQERQEGLERVNRRYGINATVKINPAYDRRTYQRGGAADDNTEY